MGIPLSHAVRVGSYVLKQQLSGRKRYPLVLMLEPLFRCNLACAGCGKIDYPAALLPPRLSVEQCLEAVEECGAPVVVIAGGEPLLHREIDKIVEGIVARKKFVILCTNALLLEKKIAQYKPSPYFTWSIHLDGDKEMHDASVCQKDVYEKAVEAIKLGANHYLAKPSNTDDIEAAFGKAPGGDAGVPVTPRAASLKTHEWEMINETLAATGFNISETARRLGMHRRTLARKLEKRPVK